MEEAVLKLCPFCGGEVQLSLQVYDTPFGDGLKNYRVTCDACQACIEFGDRATEDEVISLWNSVAGYPEV